MTPVTFKDSAHDSKTQGKPYSLTLNRNTKCNFPVYANNACTRAHILPANKLKQINQLKDQQMSLQLLELLRELKRVNRPKTCYICKNGVNCENIQKLRKKKRKHFRTACDREPILANINLIDKFNTELILQYKDYSTKLCEEGKTEKSLHEASLKASSIDRHISINPTSNNIAENHLKLSICHHSPSTSSLTEKQKVKKVKSPYFDKEQRLVSNNQRTENLSDIFALLAKNNVSILVHNGTCP